MEEEGDDFPLTPLQGTYVVGFVNGISASLAIFVISVAGRRPILIIGELFMTLFLFLCGLSLYHQWNVTAFVMINLLITSFHWSQGSVALLYFAEVCVDAASGFAISAQFLLLVLISLTFDFMIKSPLKIYGSIWIFSGLSLFGALFCFIWLRETKGLTDVEKKMLYTPKSVIAAETDE